jgi:F-type H+-transporting ATPase subunit gamma
MATLREIRSRISGVRNTQKITKAMKMVAAAKLRRAQDAIVSARPYARSIAALMKHLVARMETIQHPLLQSREVKRALVVVITADRGLCGAFNSNIIKSTIEHIHKTYPQAATHADAVQLLTVGKKSTEFFTRRGYAITARHVGIFHGLNTGNARAIVDEITAGYLSGSFDRVEVVYNEFKNVIQQRVVVEQLLPIIPEEIKKGPDLHSLADVDYIYEPSSGEIIDALIPKHLFFQMWRMLLESNASEQGARMTAMGNATENAKDLLKGLTLSYNKARQAGITKELLEITSGAEALKKAG